MDDSSTVCWGRRNIIGFYGNRSDQFWFTLSSFRSIVASCVCKLAEADESILIRLIPFDTSIYGLFHLPMNECIQSLGLMCH